MNKIKKTASAVLAAVIIAISFTGISVSAGSGSWASSYGTLEGSSYSGTWQTSNSPLFRRVTATSTVTTAAPYIYAGVVAYKNGNQVLGSSTTNTNSTSALAMDQSTEYVNASLTGEGTHAVWGSNVSRINHHTSF